MSVAGGGFRILVDGDDDDLDMLVAARWMGGATCPP